jgi:hypothetical protein
MGEYDDKKLFQRWLDQQPLEMQEKKSEVAGSSYPKLRISLEGSQPDFASIEKALSEVTELALNVRNKAWKIKYPPDPTPTTEVKELESTDVSTKLATDIGRLRVILNETMESLSAFV